MEPASDTSNNSKREYKIFLALKKLISNYLKLNCLFRNPGAYLEARTLKIKHASSQKERQEAIMRFMLPEATEHLTVNELRSSHTRFTLLKLRNSHANAKRNIPAEANLESLTAAINKLLLYEL